MSAYILATVPAPQSLILANSSSALLSSSLWTSAGLLYATVDPWIPGATNRVLATRISSSGLYFTVFYFSTISFCSYIHRSENIIPTLLVNHWPDKCPAGHTLVHTVTKAIEAPGRWSVQLQNMKKTGRDRYSFVLTFAVARSAWVPPWSRILERGGREVAACEAGRILVMGL
ncbi:hypothetical protein BDW22DRAFT_1346219 [Trametopsis cervina]|nr:hypothetical protein BDW22DRAFT_1346219 [Trametopsis cervina]